MGCADGREIRHVPGSEWGTKGPWSVGQVSVVQGLGLGWVGYCHPTVGTSGRAFVARERRAPLHLVTITVTNPTVRLRRSR